jgi:hypothetical protein
MWESVITPLLQPAEVQLKEREAAIAAKFARPGY